MALPTGMFRHPKTGMLWIRKVIPVELRPYFGGKREITKTLGTKDQKQAEPLFHYYAKEIAERMNRARAMLAGEPVSLIHTMPIRPDQRAAYDAFRLATPEGRMADIADKVDRKLEQAGLLHPVANTIDLEALYEKWKAEKKPTENSLLEFERSKKLFLRVNKILPMADYTVAHARAWKEHVLAMRAGNGKPLAHATLVKIFGSVRTLFMYADRNEYLNLNPFLKITLEKGKGSRAQRRLEWDEDELKQLFASPIYRDQERPRGGAGEASYWLPVLALYHGTRLGELCQLDRADVLKRHSIWCLRIVESDEDEQAGKRIKTEASERFVPLHKRTIELGFLDYVATITGKKLFPKISPDSKKRWAGNYSKWFGRYRVEIGLGDRFRDFHSFRHTWKSRARGARIPEEHHDEITGHENGSVGRNYGSVPIPTLKREIDKISFKINIPKWEKP